MTRYRYRKRLAASTVVLCALVLIAFLAPARRSHSDWRALPWTGNYLWHVWIGEGRCGLQLRHWYHTMAMGEGRSMGGTVMHEQSDHLGVYYAHWDEVLFESGTGRVADVGSTTSEWYIPLGLGIVPVACWFTYNLYGFLRIRKLRLAEMRGLCRKCHYNLRSHQVQGARCPECGTVVPYASGQPRSRN
jgi:hypothetical protein